MGMAQAPLLHATHSVPSRGGTGEPAPSRVGCSACPAGVPHAGAVPRPARPPQPGRDQHRLLGRYRRQRRWSEIEADAAVAHPVLGLTVGMTIADQLHIPARPPPHSAADDARVLHSRAQGATHYRVVGGDHRLHRQVATPPADAPAPARVPDDSRRPGGTAAQPANHRIRPAHGGAEPRPHA